MLPKIHLGTLMTVNDSNLANQTRECKQAQMEARMNRNMEGFYVYQNYLKRLRRMHRAYVTRFKTQQKQQLHRPQQQQQHQPRSWSFQSDLDQTPGRFNGQAKAHRESFNILNRDHANQPVLKHRFSLSGPTGSQSPDSSYSPHSSSLTPRLITETDKPKTGADTQNKDEINKKTSFSIHIPCGREESYDLNASPRSDTKANGALPFRMWKQSRDQSGRPSVYSLEPVPEGVKTKRHEVHNNNHKSVLKTSVSPDLNALFKQNK